MAEVRSGVYGRQSRGKRKSIEEQVKLGVAVANEQGWQLDPDHIYQDRVSASRFARGARDDWPRVRQAVVEHQFDVLILWESSRGDRTLETWAGFLADCRKAKVRIHVINDERTYNMAITADWEALATEGVRNAAESEKISKRVLRGQAGAAEAGRPSHGRCPFGYRRVYDPATGELVGQEPDPLTAPVVLTIFEKVAEGVPLSRLAADLELRRGHVRDIALNPTYLGQRAYNGSTYRAEWPALVNEATYYAARRVLLDPARITTRPGSQKWLLSYLATCQPCGAFLTTVRGRYRCEAKGCVTIVQAPADKWVSRTVVAYLSQPSVYKGLAQSRDSGDKVAMALRDEAAVLREQLKVWRASAAKGVTSPESLAAIEEDLVRRIRSADSRAEAALTPAVLKDFVGPGVDVAARWERAPMTSKRAVIRAIMTVKVARAAAPGDRRFDPDRLVIRRRVRAATAGGSDRTPLE